MNTATKSKHDTRHGGPYDRGSADAYYGRRFNPHTLKPNGTGGHVMSELQEGTPDWKAYRAGYMEEDDRKDWGQN